MASGIVESSQSGSSQERDKDKVQANVPRARLVQRLLAAGADLPAFVKHLIEAQGVVVAGTEAAAFLVEPENENEVRLRAIAHVRPDESTPEVRSRALEAFAEIVRPCVVQGKDGAIEIDNSKKDTVDPQFCLVTLLRSDGQVVGVSAVITRCPNIQRAQQRLTSMELVAGYFEMFTLRRASDQARAIAATHQSVLQLATTVATAEGFESAAMNLCNELATRTGATRVAMGWVHGTKIKLKAMSHTEQFDKKQELAVLIVAAMEECLDQEEIVQYEPGSEGTSSNNVTRAAAELSRRQGGVGVLTLPLRRAGEITGIILLEFNPQKKIPNNAAQSLAVAVELVSPQLFDRFTNDRWWITKTGISIRETAKMGVGPKHMLAKLIIVLVIAALSFVMLFKPMYHVTAPFSFAATEKRIISAPFDGYVGDVVKVRPGDRIKAGDVLMELDTNELKVKLSQDRWQAASKKAEARKYQSDPTKQADYRMALAEAEAYDAAADLDQSQIDHAIIKADFDGVVLSGDWMDKKRSPVRKGDELFKIGQHEGLRLEINVAERDVQDVWPGQKGTLATTSLPGDKHPFTIERVVPLAKSEQGSNVFTVYALPDGDVSPQWRDGMQGEVNIDVQKRPLGWIWTHRFLDWLRLKMWHVT